MTGLLNRKRLASRADKYNKLIRIFCHAHAES